MKLLYAPFGIIARVISSRLGETIFKRLWAKLDDEPPPIPAAGNASLSKTVGAQALQAAVLAATTAAVDGALARVFHYLFGGWPKKPPKETEDDETDET
jgi:hypothetical protein